MSLVVPNVNSISGGGGTSSAEIIDITPIAELAPQLYDFTLTKAEIVRCGRITQLYVSVSCPIGVNLYLPNGRLIDFNNSNQTLLQKTAPLYYPTFISSYYDGDIDFGQSQLSMSDFPLAEMTDSSLFVMNLWGTANATGTLYVYGTYINQYEGD